MWSSCGSYLTTTSVTSDGTSPEADDATRMDSAEDNTRLNRSLDRVLHRRFMLTITFVLGSLLLIGIAGFAANHRGRSIAEESTVRLGTELAESEANLIGNGFGRVLATTSPGQAAADNENPLAILQSLGDGSVDPLVALLLLIGGDDLESLFSSIDFHHIGLVDSNGVDLWSLGSTDGLTRNTGAFDLALNGRTTSWLDRRVALSGEDGETVSTDLIETYVPLTSVDGEPPDLVFHMARDITGTLASNVKATQTVIRNTTLIMLTILLGTLSLLVFGLDLRISRRHRAVVANEQMINKNLGTQNRELQRVDEAKNEFLGSLSHELKTPLAAILGFTQVLKRNSSGALGEKQIGQLDIIDRNGLRLNTLISDLLDLSKIQGRKIHLTKEQVEISAFLHQVVDGFETILNGKQQAATLDIQHDSAWLSFDQTRISQVLSNLLSNASKYSPKDSSITVTSRIEGDECVISVSDEGAGIRQEDQDQLFTLFYRTPDAQNSSTSGTGIGLFVSKQIVDLHGGSITLESSPGNGTTVTMRLPDVTNVPNPATKPGPTFTNSFDNMDAAV